MVPSYVKRNVVVYNVLGGSRTVGPGFLFLNIKYGQKAIRCLKQQFCNRAEEGCFKEQVRLA